jgi:hypothetical protein
MLQELAKGKLHKGFYNGRRKTGSSDISNQFQSHESNLVTMFSAKAS